MGIRSETRTTHTITIDLPDDVVGKIQMGDEVEVIFQCRTEWTQEVRQPRPMKLSYAWTRFITNGRA